MLDDASMDLLGQMETFVRIVETGSLSAAARARGLSLPAVSRQLLGLERELGTALVIRSTRHLRLTEAGQRWYAHCLQLLRDLEHARSDIGARDTPHGTLTVSVPVTFGLNYVMPRVHALLTRHRDLVINVRMEDHVVDLVSDAVDVVVRAGVHPPDSSSLISRPLQRFARYLVAAPGYLRRHGTPHEPEALAKHNCLLQLGAQGLRQEWEFSRGSEQRSVPVDGNLRVTAPTALLDAALAGLGITRLPAWLADKELAAKRLKRVLPEWQLPHASAWALYRAQSRSAASIKAFIEAMSTATRGSS